MENLPKYVESWVVKRTQERHYLCRLCAGPNDDHGPEESFRNHLSSWEHKIRIKRMDALRCKICDIQFRYPSHYKAHIGSKAHCKKENPQPKEVIEHSCRVCDVKFESKKDELRHLATKKHAKNILKTREETTLSFQAKETY